MGLDDRQGRRLILAAAAAGLVARLVFGFVYWTGKPLTHDEREYLELAASLQQGHGFTYQRPAAGTSPQFGRAPGYPLLLAAIGAGSIDASSTPARVKVAQALVGAFTVWLIGVIALRSAGPAAGALAAMIAAIYPPLVWMTAYVLSETVYSAVAISGAFLLQKAVDSTGAEGRGHNTLGLAAGALVGAAILIRPVALFFLPLAVIWLVARRRVVLAVAFVAAAIATVAPWTARNLRVHDRLILVASEGGVTFWTGNHPLATGEGDLAANPDLKRAEIEFRRAHPNLSGDELEPLYYRDALAFIREQPGRWAGLVARKAFFTLVPIGPSYALHSARYRIASVASYLLLLPFAVAGARRLWRSPRRPTAIFLLAASAMLICLVFFPQERFRIPVIDPTLIICAAALGSRHRL
jgi:4-amino-4-deoxy-L-arabinose transferase-like glycosyltransferase